MTEEQQANPLRAGCGSKLRRAREALGLSIEEMALELRLSNFQIKALEEDNWDKLPGVTYARGYVKSYAQILGMDPDRLLAGPTLRVVQKSTKNPETDTDAGASRPSIAPSAPRAQPEPAIVPSERRRGGWIGVAVVACILGIFYWQYRVGAPWIDDIATLGTTMSGLVTGQRGRDFDATTERSLKPVAQTAPQQSLDHDRQAVSAYPLGSTVAVQAIKLDRVPTPTAPGKIVFQLNEGSWIDVRDDSGKRLLYRSVPAGRRIAVDGDPPFRVYLGNAQAVQVEYMGDTIEPEVGTGRLYARFVLKPVSN